MPRKMNPLLDSTPGLLSSRTPSPRERLAGLLAGDSKPAYQGIMGLLGQSASQTPEAQWRDAFSPFGLLGAYDAGNALPGAIRNQDVLGAGMGLMAMAPIPGAPKVKPKIRAYHGSPHSFDKFSLDKIGTGEGAQAYGHGLYFAESEGVAKSYRDTLAPPSAQTVGGPINANSTGAERQAYFILRGRNGDYEAAIKHANSAMNADEVKDILRQWQKDGVGFDTPGHMYEVEINADPDSFLDWDKPLSEQSEGVRGNLEKLGYKHDKEGTRAYDDALLAALQTAEPVSLPKQPSNPTGQAIYQRTGQPRDNFYNGPMNDQLRQAGIPGIKYLDQGSRGAGDGTRNYVVFDDSIINIVRKYGIAGALAAGAISQSDALQLQEQGYQ